MRRSVLMILIAAFSGFFIDGFTEAASVARLKRRPNFLIIVTDDQRYDTFNQTFMPKAFSRIAGQGILFEKAYVTTSLCCPSRASIFTGLLARHHGIVRNSTRIKKSNFDEVNRFPEDLRNAGYFTGLVGKYLNSWKGTWRPKEFDYWVSFPDGIDDWFNYSIIKNDRVIDVTGEYITDKLLSYSLQFLEQALASENPFLLYFAPTAPHPPATPSPRHDGIYAGLPPYRPESFNEPDISDKPEWFQNQVPELTPDSIMSLDALIEDELESLAAVDEAIDTLMSYLEERGKLRDTVVVFISDNSQFWGEHRLIGKGLVYEEAIHVPMAVRYPRLISPRNSRIESKKMVANIDIAPTLYQLADIAAPEFDGSSLVPLILNPKTKWRKKLFLEGWPDTIRGDGTPDECSPPYTAVHTAQYVYSETHANTRTGAKCTFRHPDKPELYDLKNDPLQLNNLISNPSYQRIREKLKKELDEFGYVEFVQ